MSVAGPAPWLTRFLAPRHALAECAIIQWQGVGAADTPGEDAYCRVHIACTQDEPQKRIVAAAFAAFGPPVVVACADWLCEQLQDRTIDTARSLNLRDVELALALAPGERYAALLAMDALASALGNLGR